MQPSTELLQTDKKKVLANIFYDGLQENHKNVRIDTHADNASMKYILSKLGFEYTGVIYIENGEVRDAYHYVAEH